MDKQLYNIMNESINIILSDSDIILNYFELTHINDTQNVINITHQNYRLFCKFILIINDEVDNYYIECDKCHNDDTLFNMTRFHVIHNESNIYYDICPHCISSYVPNTYIDKEYIEDDIYNSRSARSLINNCNNTSKFEECIICYDKKMTYELFPHCNHSVCFDCFIKMNKQTCYYKCC